MLFSPKVSWLVKASDKSLMINFQLKYSILKSDTTTEVGIISCVTQAGSEFLSAAERILAGPLQFDPGCWGKSQRVFQGFICRTMPKTPLREGGQSSTCTQHLCRLLVWHLTVFLFLFFCSIGICVVFDQTPVPTSIIQSSNSMSDVRRLPSAAELIQSSETASGRGIAVESLSDGKRVPNVLFYYH